MHVPSKRGGAPLSVIAALGCALLMAGCAAPKPDTQSTALVCPPAPQPVCPSPTPVQPTPQPRGKLVPAAWSELLDWGRDSLKPSVDAFLAKLKVEDLGSYQDPKMGLSAAIGPDAVLPTSILYDAQGREVWRYVGDLDWTGPEAAKLLSEAGAPAKG